MYIAYFLFIMVDNVLEIKKLKDFFPKYLGVIAPLPPHRQHRLSHTTTYLLLQHIFS